MRGCAVESFETEKRRSKQLEEVRAYRQSGSVSGQRSFDEHTGILLQTYRKKCPRELLFAKQTNHP